MNVLLGNLSITNEKIIQNALMLLVAKQVIKKKNQRFFIRKK